MTFQGDPVFLVFFFFVTLKLLLEFCQFLSFATKMLELFIQCRIFFILLIGLCSQSKKVQKLPCIEHHLGVFWEELGDFKTFFNDLLLACPYLYKK